MINFKFCMAAGLVIGGSVFAELDQGLVAYYSFDGNETGWDCSGEGRDLEVIGSPALATGKRGDGLKLDGNTYLNGSVWANHAWGSALTLSFWFQHAGPEVTPGVLMSAGSEESSSWQILLADTAFGIGVGVGLHTKNMASPSRNFPILPLSAGEWYHFALVHDGESSRIFWNGTRIDPNIANKGEVVSHDAPLVIGRQFRGIIDEVRMYSRALSDDELRSLRRDEPGKPSGECIRSGIATREAAEATAESQAGGLTVVDREAAHMEAICCKTLDAWVEMYRRGETSDLENAMMRTSHRTLMWDALTQMADPLLAIPDEKIIAGAAAPCTSTILKILSIFKKGERMFALEEVKKMAAQKAEWEKAQ